MRPLGGTLIAIAIVRASFGALALVLLTFGGPQTAIVCLGILLLAQISDHLDGWLARRYSKPSVAGYLQDSISDKLFHIGCLLGLGVHFETISVLTWGILAREFVVLGARVIAPNVTYSLSQFKTYSIAYAVFVRLGLLSFFIALSVGEGPGTTLVVTGYVLLTLALLVGSVGVVRAVRGSPEGAYPRAPGGAHERH